MTPIARTPLRQTVNEALLCAVTLVAILAVLGTVAWLAGLVSASDLPWVLVGVFAGSFVRVLIGTSRRGEVPFRKR